jgi:hypothetical protein
MPCCTSGLMFGDYHETQQERALKHWLLERLG